MTTRHALNVDSFRDAVRVLARLPQRSLKSVKDRTEYLLIQETIERFKASRFSHRILYDIIMREYDGKKLEPGTVGSYLWGCYEDSCSPTCLGSLSDPDSQGCDSNIHLYREDKGLTLLNKGSKDRHIIIVPKESIDTGLDKELSKIKGDVEVYSTQGKKLERQPKLEGHYWLLLLGILALGFLLWTKRR